MHITSVTSNMLLAVTWLCHTVIAMPSPQLTYVPAGKCTYPGQFICVSDTTFAICTDALQGIEQPLAQGDNRCQNAAPRPQITQPPPVQVVPTTLPQHKSPTTVATVDTTIAVYTGQAPRPATTGVWVPYTCFNGKAPYFTGRIYSQAGDPIPAPLCTAPAQGSVHGGIGE